MLLIHEYQNTPLFAPFPLLAHPYMYALSALQVYEQVTQSRNRLSTRLSTVNRVRH